jgi:hypothetical protein
MIDWTIAGALVAGIHRRRHAIGLEAKQLARTLPRFQNIDYPLSPIPVAVAATRLDDHRRVTEQYVDLLERVIQLYRTHADVRAYFGLRPDEDLLVRTGTMPKPVIRIARLDGYLAQADGGIRILENNTDCPAGILFTGRLNRLIDHLTRDAVTAAGAELVEMPLDRVDCARRELLETYRQWGGEQADPAIAILQIRGQANVESLEMAEEFSTMGTPTFVADPREVKVSAHGVEVGGRRVELVWNKVNTVYWNRLAAEMPSLLGRWADAINSRRICHVNPFAARYVTESKLCAAFLQEAEFAKYFEPADRLFLGRVLPWSRKLEAGKTVEYGGNTWEISELLLARQSDFVLKEPYDIRGDGVTVGRSVDRGRWVELVKRAAREGHTAQEFIPGRAYPVLSGAPEPDVVAMTTSLDSFMFGGRLAGLGSKGGPGYKVNVFQGGSKLAVRVFRWSQES